MLFNNTQFWNLFMLLFFFLQPLNSSLLHTTWSNTSCVRKQGRRLLCWVVSCLTIVLFVKANIMIMINCGVLLILHDWHLTNGNFSFDLHLPANWKEVLRDYVDADQLPVVYGGSMTDPDGNPLCKTMVRLEIHIHKKLIFLFSIRDAFNWPKVTVNIVIKYFYFKQILFFFQHW